MILLEETLNRGRTRLVRADMDDDVSRHDFTNLSFARFPAQSTDLIATSALSLPATPLVDRYPSSPLRSNKPRMNCSP